MKIPFLDLRITDAQERVELLNAVGRVFDHGRMIMGPEVAELESEVATYCTRRYAVAVSSGTTALFLALKSLGINEGDEVITTSLSWIATANAISLTGARLVFADVREDLNIDPDSVRRLVARRVPRAIVPVHFSGKVCAVEELAGIAQQCGAALVEDAAQAFGAQHQGQVAGSFGKLAAFSMNPMKVLGACGEAGMVVCDDTDLYERLQALRYNGTVNKETCIEKSLNGRMDTMQAAILLQRLRRVSQGINTRRAIAKMYTALLKDIVGTPMDYQGDIDSYYSYTILADRRQELKNFLLQEGIETKVQHPILMSKQPAYAQNAVGEWSTAEKVVTRILCLPAHDKMSDDDVRFVASKVREFYKA
ncbi:MAG: DegT/DnrJ/EryC1/StrS family aminotransferase [Candidatus Omnitrophota bacterium]|nr:DegT/DnrJ/EryC1/StrS family aminotransferase [Candidatus Omnitrophota bacterium]